MKMVAVAAWRCVGYAALLAAFCEAGPREIPTDILTVTARFKVMQERIAKLQEQATGVVKVIGEVETAGGDTLKRVVAAEDNLVNTSNRASANHYKIIELKNQTDQAEANVKAVLGEMKGLLNVVEKLDSTSTSMGSQAQKVATEVADLEDKVRRLMPGASGLAKRIAKAKLTIDKYQKEVDAGVGGMVEKSLRGHFKSATVRVQSLAEDTAANNID